MSKSTKQVIKRILDLCPCRDARVWLQDLKGERPLHFWNSCDRGDWMLWLAGFALPPRKYKQLVRAACSCARRGLIAIPASDTRPLRAIETAEAWCEGKISRKRCRATALAAELFEGGLNVAGAPYFHAVRTAAHTVASVDCPWLAHHALGQMRRVPRTAAGRAKEGRACAAIVREYIKWSAIERGL